MRALYAFCRVSDDIVDRSSGNRSVQLEAWRRLATTNHPPSEQQVAVAWAHALKRYQVPSRYAEQLIDGVAREFVAETLSNVCGVGHLLLRRGL